VTALRRCGGHGGNVRRERRGGRAPHWLGGPLGACGGPNAGQGVHVVLRSGVRSASGHATGSWTECGSAADVMGPGTSRMPYRSWIRRSGAGAPPVGGHGPPPPRHRPHGRPHARHRWNHRHGPDPRPARRAAGADADDLRRRRGPVGRDPGRSCGLPPEGRRPRRARHARPRCYASWRAAPTTARSPPPSV
jgi:hypothetical protein